MKTRYFLVNALVLTAVFVSGCYIETKRQNQSTNTITNVRTQNDDLSNSIIISSEQLCKEYKENQARADKLYKDKKIRVTGKIINISSNNNGYFVEVPGSDIWFNVYIYFQNSEENKIMNLKNGQTITVIGNCKGHNYFNRVIISNSIIQN